MFCTECGTELPEQARFCPECGTEAFYPDQRNHSEHTSSEKRNRKTPDLQDLPEQKGRIDKKAPPKVSLLTILFALIGLVLIIILLHPWHAKQEKPKDFKGSGKGAQQIEFLSKANSLGSGFLPGFFPHARSENRQNTGGAD